jgi:hypothetical protein
LFCWANSERIGGESRANTATWGRPTERAQ